MRSATGSGRAPAERAAGPVQQSAQAQLPPRVSTKEQIRIASELQQDAPLVVCLGQ